MKRAGHGGARAGAGAKPKPQHQILRPFSCRLPQDVIDYLEQFGRDKGRVVASAVRRMMGP